MGRLSPRRHMPQFHVRHNSSPHDHQGNPSHPVRCSIASSTLLGIGLRMILTSTTNPIDGT